MLWFRVVEFAGLEQRRHLSNGGVFCFVPPWKQRAAFTDAARRSLGAFVKLTRKRCASCNIC
jgi:hypothetical protein